jgi:hypothetical protein
MVAAAQWYSDEERRGRQLNRDFASMS